MTDRCCFGKRLPLYWIVVALLGAAGCSGSSPTTPTPSDPPPALPSSVGPVPVSRVIDGDTIVVDTVGTVRLIGVDTPETVAPGEPVGCFGPEASAFTRSISTGRMVRLEFDTDRVDRFGRTLAYVYLPDEVFLNATLVQQGYAYAYTVFPFRYVEQFRMLEREARDARRGLWASCAAPQVALKRVSIPCRADAGGDRAHGDWLTQRSQRTEGYFLWFSVPRVLCARSSLCSPGCPVLAEQVTAL